MNTLTPTLALSMLADSNSPQVDFLFMAIALMAVVGVAYWIVKWFGWPAICWQVVAGIVVVILCIRALDVFGIYHWSGLH